MRWHKQIIIAALLGAAAGGSACGPSVNEIPMPAALMGRCRRKRLGAGRAL